eukprot:3382260-Ditylum_brightwellii.AAC.1
MGDSCIALCNIPREEELVNSSKENHLDWDCLENFMQTGEQPDSSYHEQRLTIKTCKEALDSYSNIFSQDSCTKYIRIRRLPGS